MKKIKIVAMLTTVFVVCSALASISGAVELNADINVEIREWIGYVAPTINISTDDQRNQSVDIEVNANYTSGVHKINDTITINLNIDDQSNRKLGLFIVPRFVVYKLALKQDPDDILETPTWKTTGYEYVVRSLFGKPVETIEAKLGGFSIDNETLNKDGASENRTDLYLVIQTVGFLPGNVNGYSLFGDDNPIVDRGVVKLSIDYVDLI